MFQLYSYPSLLFTPILQLKINVKSYSTASNLKLRNGDHNLVNQFGKEINNASTLYNTSQIFKFLSEIHMKTLPIGKPLFFKNNNDPVFYTLLFAPHILDFF